MTIIISLIRKTNKNNNKIFDINLGSDFNEWDIDINDIPYKNLCDELKINTIYINMNQLVMNVIKKN